MISSKIGYFSLVTQLLESTVKTLVRPSGLTFENVLVQIGSIGVGAIPASSLIAVTAGFVLALVLELQLSQIGKVEIVPSLLWIILTEQVVPVGVALIFAGRSVSAVTAELGIRLYRSKPTDLDEWINLAGDILAICNDGAEVAA